MRFATIALAALLVFATLAVAVDKKDFLEPVEGTRQLLDCTNAVPVVCGGVYNGDNTGAIFDERSGNNTLVGNGTIVTDNGGAFDCDGDGWRGPF